MIFTHLHGISIVMKKFLILFIFISSHVFSQNYLSPISSFQTLQPFWTELNGIHPEDILHLFVTDHRTTILDRVKIPHRSNILIFHDIHLLFQELLTTRIMQGRNDLIDAIHSLIEQLEGPIKDDLQHLSFNWDTFFQRKAPYLMTKNIAGKIATLHRAYLVSVKDSFNINHLQLFGTRIELSDLFPTDFPDSIVLEGVWEPNKVSYKINAEDAQLEIAFTEISPAEILLGNGTFKDRKGTRMRQFLNDRVVPLIQKMGYDRLSIQMIHPSHIAVFESIGFVQDHSRHLTMVYHLKKEASLLLSQSA